MPDTMHKSEPDLTPEEPRLDGHPDGHALGIEHGYGPRVHILEDAWTAATTAKLSSPECTHTELVQAVRALTARLATAAFGRELPTVRRSVTTRMAEKHGALGTWEGEALDPAAEIVVLDVIRGGIIPSQTCFELLSLVHPIDSLRLDHLNMQRVAGDDGRVDRVELTGSKVGGSIEGATLVIPDPMGATGGTILRALEHLKASHGVPSRLILIPLICTPEFLKAVLAMDVELSVYTARVDRGMSAAEVLASPLGSRWAEERGLDDEDYIVPGAGGVGEVLNHSWA